MVHPLVVLDPASLPDDRLFTGYLDWAITRNLITGYDLVLYHQTGPTQGTPTRFSSLPRGLSEDQRAIANDLSEKYQEGDSIPAFDVVESDGGSFIYRSPVSITYEINLGQLLLFSDSKLEKSEIDQFVSLAETTIAIRKKAIAASLNPPFVDLALEDQVQLDAEVGTTLKKAIQANETHVLRFADDMFETAFTDGQNAFILEARDPLVIAANKAGGVAHYQDIMEPRLAGLKAKSSLLELMVETGNRSALLFTIEDQSNAFALAICLFKRPHAVSGTEISIAQDLREKLSHYYRLGFERHKSATAADQAEEVEKRALQALVIADLMHDATDDIISLRNNLLSLNPRTELEELELNNAKNNLKQLIATARLFKFLFTGHGKQLSVESAMAAGDDYYRVVNVGDLIETIRAKHEKGLQDGKIELINKCPKSLTVECMEVSLQRAIDNCVKNSIKHLALKTHISREISISGKETLTDGRKWVEICVTDNGPGIEKELVPTVMNPFVSYSKDGMGLGLAIVRTVCDIHGGKVNIDSDWGKSTEVTLRFPQSPIK